MDIRGLGIAPGPGIYSHFPRGPGLADSRLARDLFFLLLVKNTSCPNRPHLQFTMPPREAEKPSRWLETT